MPFAYFIWDPHPGMFDFQIPLLHRPILWYGFFFALGFLMGYRVLLQLLKRHFHRESRQLAELLTFYVLVGAVVGARLGDVLFYQDWRQVVQHPLSIVAIWEGGLASHGGAVGILVALWLLSKKRKLSFWTLLDFTVIPASLGAVCIRIGNFFNQEILGTPSDLPWAVLFLHPADGSALVPRHPVQLYESLGYLLAFGVLLLYWRKHKGPLQGRLSGLFLMLVFGLRFFLEWVKLEQSVYLSQGGWLTMGQWLSLPFFLLGAYLFFRKRD